MIIKKLRNGIILLVSGDNNFQTISTNVSIGYGSIYENPNVNGSAHFLEHMLFKGTSKRSWKDISNQMRNIGAYSNASTDFENTNYMTKCFKKYFETSVDIVSDMIKNSIIPIDEFEKERGAIINENLISENNPRDFGSEYLPKVLFKDYPAKMPIGGNNKLTIKKISREHLYNIYSEQYAPENIIISVYGGINSDNAINLLEEHFGDFERKYKHANLNACNEKQFKKELYVIRKGVTQTRIAIGYKCIGTQNMSIDEFIAMRIGNTLLSNLAYDEIREKNGLAYDPSGACNIWKNFGFISLDAGVEPKDLKKTKSIMLNILNLIVNDSIPEEELERARTQTAIGYKTLRENTLLASIVQSGVYSLFNDKTLFDNISNRVENIKLGSVIKALQKYIIPDEYGMVVLSGNKITEKI